MALSRQDMLNIIRLLQAALNYPDDTEELDTYEFDVLRWESEGGSLHYRV